MQFLQAAAMAVWLTMAPACWVPSISHGTCLIKSSEVMQKSSLEYDFQSCSWVCSLKTRSFILLCWWPGECVWYTSGCRELNQPSVLVWNPSLTLSQAMLCTVCAEPITDLSTNSKTSALWNEGWPWVHSDASIQCWPPLSFTRHQTDAGSADSDPDPSQFLSWCVLL